MADLKLEKYITISGIIKCKTGLRIGGSKEDIDIGGLDNPILRDPVDKMPYIPGSSLKGKMRSVLEYKYDRVGWHIDRNSGELRQDKNSGQPCGCGEDLDKCPVCKIFGPHKNTRHKLGPTRIIVRDAIITDESQSELEKLAHEGLQYAEVKIENTINRATNTAGDPRQMERVPKNTEFDLNISLRVFRNDDDKTMVKYIQEALTLLQKDYLGGSGTRGYGWVEVKDVKIDEGTSS